MTPGEKARSSQDRDSGRAAARQLQPEDVVRWGPVWGRRVGQILDHVVWSTKVLGAKNVPRSGPVILAANHMGVIDGPVLHGASPRGSHIIVKQEMFTGFLGLVLRYSGQVPVDRASGRAALTAALALLEEGRVVGIFPEGTRGSGAVASAQAGVAWLAVRSGAPVVPVAILGTRPSGKGVGHVPRVRSRLYVVFGEPFAAAPEDAGTGRAALAAAMETIQAAMSAHVRSAAERTGAVLPGEDEGEPPASPPADGGPAERPAPSGPAAPVAERLVGHQLTVGRRMSAPPSAVWDVITDLDGAVGTLSGVTRLEVLTPGGYSVGTRWRETRRMLGREATEEMWVTEVVPGERTVVEAESDGARYRSVFELTPAGSGSQLDITFGVFSVNPSRAQRVMWAVFGRLGLRATRKALEQDLKDIAAASRGRVGGEAGQGAGGGAGSA